MGDYGMTAASSIVVGLVLLLLGRTMFWVFVGAAGFIAGLALATDVLGPQPEWVRVAVGLVAGLVGALLAVLLERLAVGIAGFLVGGYVAARLVVLAYPGYDAVAWLVGGVLGALLVLMLLDPALIVLSSLAGATLVTEGIAARGAVAAVVFAVSLAVGLVVQSMQLDGRR
jgi:hypothetical protein